MATAATIKKNIAKLEAALKSKATPKTLKPKLEAQLVKSKAELSGINKGTKPKTSSTKSTQTALQKLKEMVNKNKKFKTYKGAGVDLEKDADRPALRTGKRIAKESGKTYYEYRANRIDVKQPPKKYPKLEKGGYMAKGGKVSDLEKTIIKTEKSIEYFQKEKENGNEYADFALKSLHNYLTELKDEQANKYAEGGEVSHKYYVTYVSQSFDGKNYKNGFDLYSTNGDADEEIFIGNYSKLEEANKVAENKGLERLPMYMRMSKGGYYADGGYVAVSEKDGYWYIMSKPTTKEKAQEMINLGVPSGEVGKVVTLDEAKSHKKVIGEEYLEKGGYMAKGGALEHGLMVGDTVRDVAENSVAIYNHNDKKSYVVDLDKGTRTEWIGSFEKEMKYAKHGAYMAMGGEMHRTQE